ncbi:MAG: hypothetical protein GX847_02135, partial [Clostridiales bacterium]|nr:hypothetical protein [Clostridiales bacterium]
MKKIIAVLIIMVLAFSLFACSGGKTAANPSSAAPSETTSAPGGDAEPSGDAPAASDNAPAGSTVSIGSREWYETDDYDHFGR